MPQNSNIEWTDATWNPVRGCSRISEGCRNCYAEGMAARFSKPGNWGHTFAIYDDRGPRWTGKVELVPHLLDWPKSVRTPKRIFANSTSDLFHEDLPDEDVFRVFKAMAAAPHHTFQVLTKRADRMAALVPEIRSRLVDRLEHVWLGVSVENQNAAEMRLDFLLRTPARTRFLSCEPLLGPLDLSRWLAKHDPRFLGGKPIDWIIVGGESGRGARPMRIEWASSIVAAARAKGVSTFVKQLGTVRGGRAHHDINTFPADLRVREFPDEPRTTPADHGALALRGKEHL